MKILVITPRFPHPLDKGDKLRAYHQIRLMSKNHEIVVCALSERPVSQTSLDALRPWCSRIEVLSFSPGRGRRAGLGAMVLGLPYQVGYFTHSEAAGRFRAVVDEERPDLVFCQLVRTAEYVKDLSCPCLLDYMDAFSSGMAQRATVGGPWARGAHALEHRLLERYERRVFDRFGAHTIISERDRAALPFGQKQSIRVVPNGVDSEVFSPRDSEIRWDLLFVGNMAYPPNVRAAQTLVQDILPRIRAHRPGIRVLIAGANPTVAVRRLASDAVEVSGWVDDVVDCYAKSRVFVAPMEWGTGMQNKLLQAMAMELPCVTTPLASEALGHSAGVMRVGSDPEDLAQCVVALLDQPEVGQSLGRKGREIVVSQFQWESTAQALEGALQQAVVMGRPDDG
ncbi:MAG: hypothetical protein DRJ65_11215 [Acidobacteria bacterium]|nr:MAG: hypothetical protein DRJ65_11215 [Acidobacteriota bacterium]